MLVTTLDVCRTLGLTEPGLRHVLRRRDAPRPLQHPSSRIFLWTHEDIRALAAFLAESLTAECGKPRRRDALELNVLRAKADRDRGRP